MHSRRSFLRKGCAALAVSMAGCSPPLIAARGDLEEKNDILPPPEYLMRDHGVLSRILLVYEESIRRMGAGESLPVESLAQASRMARNFVEDFHQRLEEDLLFPRFRKAGRFVDLVTTLVQQHNSGRKLTDAIIQTATAKGLKDPEGRRVLIESMQQYIRIYRAHAAREDTVLFPGVRGIMTPREFALMGEEFENRGEERYGYTGYFRIVEQVTDIEKRLGIADLAKLTPSP
ncbi:MAG TPA: hemerythrin domain-containing protein [Deltaproteobacteria bacterium]|nr:hemerythrin domain-containing protein [Deltaproteobacteria bacterium]